MRLGLLVPRELPDRLDHLEQQEVLDRLELLVVLVLQECKEVVVHQDQ